MNDLILTDDIRSQLQAAELAIQEPRTPFELRHFVVGQHDTEPRQWAQCTLELASKVRNLRRAQINEQIILEKIDRLKEKGKHAKAALLAIDLEDQQLAVLGAQREAAALLAIWQSFPRQYTREELNESEADYWRRRLARQAAHDLAATGRVGVGNQDALRMAGMPAPGGAGYIQEVERRFLEVGKVRILIAVPTLIPRDVIERESLRCLDGWEIPATIERRLYVVQGKAIDAAYNDAAQTAMQDGADFLLTVEDDHVIPPGSFDRIWSVYQQHGPRAIVGAWYPQRKEPRAGAAIVVRNGRREYLSDGQTDVQNGQYDVSGLRENSFANLDMLVGIQTGVSGENGEGLLRGSSGVESLGKCATDTGSGGPVEVYTIPQGFTLIPTAIFRELPHPWFATTGSLTQDSFFSQLAREAGYKLLVDTSCRIGHVDRKTGHVYQ